ncbi:hypothetical protein [Prevotella falsenii]|nr:hypothetical protein [Prevotella falsenii]
MIFCKDISPFHDRKNGCAKSYHDFADPHLWQGVTDALNPNRALGR